MVGVQAVLRLLNMQNISQKGAAHLLIPLILAAVGLIIYFLITSAFPFKDKLFSLLYPKPVSRASQGPPVTVDAKFYPDVKTKLLAGDLLKMPAVRQSSDSAMTADHWKFQEAITALNSVDKNEIGVKKGIVLSAVDDVRNLIGNIPADVDWVSYNMEPGMTPPADFVDPAVSVKQFADVVHTSGRKMGFAPLRSYIDNNQGTQQMSDIINSVDAIAYQGQLLLPSIGEDAFVQTVQQKYAYVKGVNSNVEFSLQLWLGRQTPQEIINAFNRLTNSMDNAGIGTHDINKTSQVQEVLSGLSWRQQSSTLFPLGIHLVPDADINTFWNNHALSTDVSTGWPANINFVAGSSAGVKVLTYGEGVDPEATMNSAVSAGIKMVMANLEQITDISALLAREASDYQLAKSKGLTFIFAPMGTTLKQYYSYNDFAMLKNADMIFYQTQIMQDNATLLGTTDPSAQITQYASIVKDLIHQMRPYIPQRKVWVQVSVNPPQNRNTTADRVIQYIDSITDGSADSPDEIQIFYKYTDYPEQIPVLKQVIEHYRPVPTPTPTPDTQPPAINITYPVNGSTVKGGSTVNISADASDNVGITQVEFYINNNLQCTDMASPYNCSWNVPRGKKTTYTLNAKAYDQANNTSSASITITTANK